MKIMVVDDSESSRLLIEAILRAEGYKDLVPVESGQEALKWLHQDHRINGFCTLDLIMMDIVMPEWDGIETTRRIKQDDRFTDVPVVIITVVEQESSLERALEAGAIDYLTKPVNKIEMRARVRSVLRLKREIDIRNERERERERLIKELQGALAELKVLSGLLPICSVCKKIRDDKGYWNQLESYISEHSHAQFSHSICPKCLKELYPDFADVLENEGKEPVPDSGDLG